MQHALDLIKAMTMAAEQGIELYPTGSKVYGARYARAESDWDFAYYCRTSVPLGFEMPDILQPLPFRVGVVNLIQAHSEEQLERIKQATIFLVENPPETRDMAIQAFNVLNAFPKGCNSGGQA